MALDVTKETFGVEVESANLWQVICKRPWNCHLL